MKKKAAVVGMVLGVLLAEHVGAQSLPYIYEAKAEYVAGTNPKKTASMPCRRYRALIPFISSGCKTGYLIACPGNVVFTFSKKKGWQCPERDNNVEVAVPYDNMTALARGQPKNKLSDVTSISSAATLGTGVSAVATKNQWVGIGAAAAAAFTLLFTYRYYESQ